MTLLERLGAHRLIVCVGTGGVGKTTLSAALALAAARRGQRALVLTIDPARKLAQAMGLEAVAIDEEVISGEAAERLGVRPPGSLHAGMLDQKRAWDALIARHAPSDQRRDAILANAFYKHLSGGFGGALEYAALEELCRLDESGDFDRIVLDTPPTSGALDFLRAPARIEALLLDRELMAWLTRPLGGRGRDAWEASGALARRLLRRLERATGGGTLRDVSGFFIALGDYVAAFAARSRQLRSLLRGEASAFVLVTGPGEAVLADAAGLASELRELGIELRAVILNRAHPLHGRALAADAEIAAALEGLAREGMPQPQGEWLARVHAEARATVAREQARWSRFLAELPSPPARGVIPELDHDVGALTDIAALAAELENPLSETRGGS